MAILLAATPPLYTEAALLMAAFHEEIVLVEEIKVSFHNRLCLEYSDVIIQSYLSGISPCIPHVPHFLFGEGSVDDGARGRACAGSPHRYPTGFT